MDVDHVVGKVCNRYSSVYSGYVDFSRRSELEDLYRIGLELHNHLPLALLID